MLASIGDSNVQNNNFYNQTRIGEDNCGVSQLNIQDAASSNYMLQSYYLNDCGMKKPIIFATSQPNVNFSAAGGAGNQCGIGGCNIESNSNLLIGSVQTHPKCKISLFQRPFATVPYLGRGPSNAVLESQLQQGGAISNKKSINNLSEVSYGPISNYPLIPSLRDTVTNPKYLVEGAAAEGWVRGGVPTRELTKEKEYTNNQTSPHQYAG